MKHKIWLMGGLGNQLYQVNYGYKLKEKGFNISFIDNLTKESFLTKNLLSWTVHPYVLDDIVSIETHAAGNITPVIFSKVNFFNKWSNYLELDYIPNNLPENIFGYFQEKRLQDKIFFNDNIHPSLFKTSGAHFPEVVVHLRFGDAPNLRQNIEYYCKALRRIESNIVCICTDDQNFATNFLKENNFFNYYFSNGSLKYDFKQLVNAKVIVIAPSTFSWWAVRLSHVVSEVYMPKDTYNILGSPSNFAKIYTL